MGDVVAHFNDISLDNADLGDILVSNAQAFNDRVKFLSDEVAEKYAEELQK